VNAVNGNYVELARRLTTLSQRFARVSTELAEAGRSLLDRRALPSEGLVEELGAVQADFEDLRAQVVAAASALAGGAPPPVTTLRELEVLIRAISDRETARARRRAEEEAADAQRRAEEDGRRVAEQAKQKAEVEARRKADEEATRKAELEARRKAEEEAKRKAEEEAKGKAEQQAKRKVEEEARRKAEEEARRKAEEEARRKAEDDARRRALAEAQAKTEAEARRKTDDEARRRAQEEAQRRAEEAAREQAELRRRGEAEGKRKAEEEARRKSEEQTARREAEEIARRQAEEDARQRGEEDARRRDEQAHRPAEEPVEAPVAAAEDEGQDLGLETAQWWISASASWASMKSKQTAFAAAVHDILAKYPYVFSVPIQSSTDYEDGLLAYGYAVLLDHVEQRRPGFVEGALDHLPARQGASLGRRLYDYLAAALRDSYVEFVKAIMVAALPRSPLWVTAGVEDSDTATTAFTRPTARIGDPTQKTERSAQDQQRFADRRFVADVAPLTTRFFRVEAAEVREPRVVDIRLSEKSAPSDQAWLVMTPRTGAAQARRQEQQGTMIAGIGRDYTAVWIAIFNTDAETEKRFELTVGVRKRGAGAASSFRKPR
jgi:chemotaxis protein histidine kinase CheA